MENGPIRKAVIKLEWRPKKSLFPNSSQKMLLETQLSVKTVNGIGINTLFWCGCLVLNIFKSFQDGRFPKEEWRCWICSLFSIFCWSMSSFTKNTMKQMSQSYIIQ